MNPERQQAIDYLRAPKGGLWNWAESGKVLVWHDGTTIGFREEVIQILEWLAPNGLPSFGAIVFLMAACKGRVPQQQEITTPTLRDATAPVTLREQLLMAARFRLGSEIENARAQLQKVANLPVELRSSSKGKCVLAEAVFEANATERYVQARAVLQGLREPFADSDLLDTDANGVDTVLVGVRHEALDDIRSAEARRMKADGYEPVLAKSRYGCAPPASTIATCSSPPAPPAAAGHRSDHSCRCRTGPVK